MNPWESVLEYWFGKEADGSTKSFWFKATDETDADIRARFGDQLASARRGELDGWADEPRGRLALIIVLDQLSRNIYRNRKEAYDSDTRAQALCIEGIKAGHDRQLAFIERVFHYMPLMHAEDLTVQDRSIEMFKQLADDAAGNEQASFYKGNVDYARDHRAVIEKFGRFPHRNEILGRESSDPEKAHLATGKWF